MKVVYIVGPYRADTTYGVYQNIRRAEAAAIKLWRENWAVLCPHLNTQLFDQAYDLPPEVYYKGDLEFVRRSDAVYVLKGWEKSDGSVVELVEATKRGLEIYYEGG